MGYEWNKREPSYSGAEVSRLWELSELCRHYHPSVVQFAQAVAKGEPISYAGDALRDFGLMPFLDKFVFKNPKAPKRQGRGGSIMQSAASADGGRRHGADGGSVAINHKASVAELLDRPAERVAAHERFFHTFFAGKRAADARAGRGKQPKRKVADADDDDGGGGGGGGDDDEADDEEEEEAFATRLARSLLDDDFDEDEDDEGMDGFDDDDDDDDEGEEEEEEDDDDDEGADDDAGLDGIPGVDDEEEEEEESARKQNKKKRKKAGGGATFADAEAFAHMLEAAGDDNEGLHPKLAAWEGGSRKKKRF
jgi:ribosome biogenesis protein MAK21